MTNRFVSPEQQFANNAGQPYAGGQLFFYISGTSTPTPTYQDQALTTPNSNPVVLDAAGNAGNIFLNSSIVYKVVLEDANNNLIWTFDPVIPTDAPSGAVSAIISCTPSGGPNAITLTPINASQLPAVYANYTVFAFVPSVTTTGAVTLQVGALAFYPAFSATGVQLGANDLVANQGPYFFAYGSIVAGATPGFLLLNGNSGSSTVAINSPTTISNIHNNKIVQIGGGSFFAVSFPAGSSLAASFKCTIVNEEATPIGKGIGGLDIGSFVLYPGQSYQIINDGGTLRALGGKQLYIVNSVALFCNASLGSDDPLVADGLGTGSRARLTQSGVKAQLYRDFDHNGSQPVVTLTGSFLENVTFAGQPINTGVFFWNGSAPGAYTVRQVAGFCWILGDGATLECTNVYWEGNGNTATAIQMHQTAILDILSGCTFGNFNVGTHISSDGAGYSCNIDAGYTIANAGNANVHWSMGGVGILTVTGNITITINGGPAPVMAFWVRLSGPVLCSMGSGVTFSGGPGVGTQQWAIGQASWLSRSGSTIPGSVAGNPVAGVAPAAATGWVS